ncbi:MAG TPA: glutathione peroxidase [Gammaproteobacteria bacterium]|nr:glutathione peroxidase [Gammaproteobacteria bacterium]
MTTLYDFSATDIGGADRSLREFEGRAVLVVNVASKCGFTQQYAGLEALWRKFRDRGFAVLGFPCDQFGHQEPGDEGEIARFCAAAYDVTFPMFAKIEVNGANAHPLYRWLKAERPGFLRLQAVKWNFTKFLVDARGRPVKRYAPADSPEKIEPEIAALLGGATVL